MMREGQNKIKRRIRGIILVRSRMAGEKSR